jgi:hypothetical protein
MIAIAFFSAASGPGRHATGHGYGPPTRWRAGRPRRRGDGPRAPVATCSSRARSGLPRSTGCSRSVAGCAGSSDRRSAPTCRRTTCCRTAGRQITTRVRGLGHIWDTLAGRTTPGAAERASPQRLSHALARNRTWNLRIQSSRVSSRHSRSSSRASSAVPGPRCSCAWTSSVTVVLTAGSPARNSWAKPS